MLDAEDKCRKLYACHHKFSLDVESWVERCHAYYRQLIKLRWQMLELNTSKPWKTGINVGNLKGFARSCEIDSPMSLSLDQLMFKYKTCKGHTKVVMLKAPWLRKQFLCNKLQEVFKDKRLEEAR